MSAMAIPLLAASQTTSDSLEYFKSALELFKSVLPHFSNALASFIALAILIAACIVVWILFHHVIRPIVLLVIRRTENKWDDAIAKSKALKRTMLIPPALVLYAGFATMQLVQPPWDIAIKRTILALIVLMVARVLSAALGAANLIYSYYDISRTRPIKGFIQAGQVVMYFVGGILMLSVILAQSPGVFLTGLGAIAAVLLLVFQNSILSLVAGIQLTSANQIKVGDWIEMPDFNADGFVVDIALNTVTVRNWDYTKSIIPAHNFLDHAFKSWEYVFEFNARRIKRSIVVDVETIRFIDKEEFEGLCDHPLLAPHLVDKKTEMADYNWNSPQEQAPARAAVPQDALHSSATDEEADASSRPSYNSMTNFGAFRAYVDHYAHHHPNLRTDLIMAIRTLQPTSEGLPLEIYAYSARSSWTEYEPVQSEIFEHLFAVLPYFGLRVYQRASARDIQNLGSEGPNDGPAMLRPRGK